MAETYPYEDQIRNEPYFLFSIMLLQAVVSGLLLFLSALIFSRFFQIRKRVVLHLAMTFLFMGASFASATIPIALAFTAPHIELIKGIPIYENFHFWWTNVSYLLMALSILFLLRFSSMVFAKRETVALFSVFFWIFIVLVGIFSIWDIYQGIVIHTLDVEGISLPTLPWAILFLIIGVIPWVILMFPAFQLYNRIRTSLAKTGTGLIGLSALCTILSYLMFVLRAFIVEPFVQDVMEIAYCGFFIFTAILLYIGYTLPPWFRKRIESKMDANKKTRNQEHCKSLEK